MSEFRKISSLFHISLLLWENKSKMATTACFTSQFPPNISLLWETDDVGS